MRLGGLARYLVEIASEDDLLESLKFASEKNLKIHVVGTGSNTIFQDEGFHGLVIVNRIIGVTEESHDDTTVLTVGAVPFTRRRRSSIPRKPSSARSFNTLCVFPFSPIMIWLTPDHWE